MPQNEINEQQPQNSKSDKKNEEMDKMWESCNSFGRVGSICVNSGLFVYQVRN